MALTRNFLKAMGLTEEQIGSIIENHMETVDALKKERDGLRTQAESAAEVAKERDGLREQLAKAGDAAKVQAEFDAYKQKVEGEKTTARKTTAVRAALKEAGVNREEFAELLLGKVDLSKVELDGDKVKDADGLIAPLKGSYAGCFGTVTDKGTPLANPPAGGGKGMTKDQILAIKDPAEQRMAIAQNLDLFNK